MGDLYLDWSMLDVELGQYLVSPDAREGVTAFLSGRKPMFRGSDGQAGGAK